MNDAPDTTGQLTSEKPWPALRSFREADQFFFGGRETEIDDVVRRITAERVTLVFGVSGLGKTSLLRAGVFPRLRKLHFLPVYIRLDYELAQSSLITQILDAIAEQAGVWHAEAGKPIAGETLWEYFHRLDVEFWDAENFPCVPVLVFDQFEEIFATRNAGNPEVRDLFEQLIDLANGELPRRVKEELARDKDALQRLDAWDHRYRLVFGIREDQLAQLESVSDRFRAIFANRFRLRRMSGEAALRSTLKAAKARNLMTPAVARRIVRFVAGQKDEPSTPAEQELPVDGLQVEPALLSVVCSELNRVRLERGETTITAATLSGSKEDVLRRFYEDGFDGLPAAMKTFVEDALVGADEVSRDFVSEQRALQYPGVTKEALKELDNRRVIRIDEIGADRKVELTHDLLVGVAAERRAERKLEEQTKKREAAERTARRSLYFTAVLLTAILAAAFYYVKGKLLKRDIAHAEARSSFRLAMLAFGGDRSGEGLAYLARVLRHEPDDRTARAFVYDEIVTHRWPILVSSAPLPGRIRLARISPDGKMIAVVTGRSLQVLDATGKGVGQTAEPIMVPSAMSITRLTNSGVVQLRVGRGIRQTTVAFDPKANLPLSRQIREERAIGDVAGDGAVIRLEGEELVLRDAAGSARVSIVNNKQLDLSSARFTDDDRHVLLTRWIGKDQDIFVARIWDRDTRKLGRWITVKGALSWFASRNGEIVFVMGETQIQQFDSKTGKEAGHPIATAPARYRLLSPDGSRLLLQAGESIQLLSLPDGEVISKSFPGLSRTDARLVAAVFSADSLRFATATSDGAVRCWSATTGEPISETIEDRASVRAVAFADEGRSLITVSDAIRKWRIKIGVSEPVLRVGEADMAANAAPPILAVQRRTGDVSVVDDRGRALWGIKLPAADLHLIRVASNGLMAFTKGGDGDQFVVLDRGGRQVFAAKEARRAAFTQDGRFLIAASKGNDGIQSLRVFSTSNWRPVSIVSDGDFVVSPSGRYLATLNKDGQATLRELPTGNELGHDATHKTGISGDLIGAFSNDEAYFAMSTGDGNIRAWTVPQMRLVQTVPDDLENVAGVAFAPSGELLALYGRNGLHLIRIGGKWEKEGEVPVSGAVESVQFSAEDLRLLVVLDDHAEVWDVHEPKEPRPVLRRIPKDEETPAMLSADGQRVFTFVSGDLIRSDVISFDSPEDGKVLADLAETLGRVQVSEIGNVKPVDAGSTLKTVAEKHCRMRDPGACRVARWLLQPDGKETLSPVSQTSLADYIRIESARKSVQIWTSLATLFPGHPALGEKPPPPPATE